MHRVLFVVPGLGFTLHGFGLMLLLATFGALRLDGLDSACRERLDPDDVYGLATWLLTGGVIGARVLYVVQYPQTVHNVGDVFRLWQGGIVFYGCILGGLTAARCCTGSGNRSRSGQWPTRSPRPWPSGSRRRADRVLLERLLLRPPSATSPGPCGSPPGPCPGSATSLTA